MSERGMDTRSGQIILAVAVMSILLTAPPLGAFAISWGGGKHLLSVDGGAKGSSSSALEESQAEYDLLKD